MKTQVNVINLLRLSGICLLIVAVNLGLGTKALAQSAMPEKLGVRAQAKTNAESATAEVTIALLDAQNRLVPATRDVQVNLNTRLASGVQHNQLVVKAGETSVTSSLPLQEGGLIEFSATQPQSQLRSGSAFIRLKPFTRHSGPVANYTPYSANDAQSGSTPNTHFGKEVAKVGGTANSVTDTVQSVKGAADSVIRIFSRGPVAAGVLAGAEDRVYLADGQDGAVVQVFLGQAVKKETRLVLSAPGGRLNPETIIIAANHDSGQAVLTSDQAGTVTVCVPGASKIAGAPTNSLTFQFRPAIARVLITANPPKINLFETTAITIQFLAKDSNNIASDVERQAALGITRGRGVLDSMTLVVPANKPAPSVKFTPTLSGKTTLRASVAGLSDQSCELEVTLPTLLMGLTGFGGALGGLLAAFQKGLPTVVRQGPLRRRFQALPWWRMAIGSVTGFVLYWAIMFLSFAALPKTLALNPASAVVCALLGGWLGLSVFSLVLKALRITKGPDGASPPSRRPLAEARG